MHTDILNFIIVFLLIQENVEEGLLNLMPEMVQKIVI